LGAYANTKRTRSQASPQTITAGGFTLVEVLIALGIMSIGITAVIGVFTMATSTHKRAIDEASAALIAQSAVSEMRAELTARFDASALEVVGGGPPVGASGAAAGGEAPPPVLAFRKGARDPAFPGYSYDVLLTPLDAAKAADADLFHVEVRVRWLATGKVRGETFHTVALRTVVARDLRE
jgi:prepilin-type N-terminal cleavage/methylation domain-containing protein